MSRADRDRYGSLFVAVGALFVAATCSREGRLEPVSPAGHVAPVRSAAPPPVTPPSATAALSASTSALPLAAPSDVPNPAPAPGVAVLRLPNLEHALAGLESKKRGDHVRILWLGDSHTAADFMTGEVRKKLGERFGVGGPGLVRLGVSSYRHEGVKLVHEGHFRIEPEPPSRRSTEGDTALGFEGMRAIPADARARVEALVDARAVRGTVHYELLFDLPPGASFHVAVGGTKHLVDARTHLGHVPGSPIARLALEGPPSDPLELGGMTGAPRFYGMLAEGSEPGIVLDTSGIDGARVATALAWNADVFAAELRARRPDLVAIAYGTNEAFDSRRAESIGTELSALVERVRRGAPHADCLVIGPPDAAATDFTSLPHVIEIEAVLGQTAARL
ncbi:MAG TPA: GDSL-type esterase/lipase family protein, partial [Polyangiaceae bacterium]|nr:GDSL-type esterase/lipase family protein [Polyangiaceae bacterium]